MVTFSFHLIILNVIKMSANQNVCAVCKVPATQICAGCKNVYYCNRDHQKKHWKEGHKNNCSCYKVLLTENLGHHLIATRDIKQNDIILKDTPIVIGPAKNINLSCLGCYKRIKVKPGEEYRCKNCNWPLCGKKCQDTVHRTECKILKEKLQKEQTELNVIEKGKLMLTIATLRCLLLKNTPKYGTLKNVPVPKISKDHEEQIKSITIPFIKNLLPTDEKEILNIASLFDIYSLEIIKENANFRGFYPVASFMKHNCKPNTKHSFHENNQIYVLSTVPISKGQIITTSYSEILWGTLTRRAHLLETKNILCDCSRCSDNTEFGTYLSAIFCSKCKKENEIICPKILSTDPLNQAAIWKCEKCNHTIRGRQMVWGNEAIKSEINRIDKTIPLNLEQFLVKYKETLHPKNYHSLVAKYALCQIYGNHEKYLYSGK